MLRENLAKHQEDLRAGEAQLHYLKKQSQISSSDGADAGKGAAAKGKKKGAEEENEVDIH